MNAEEVNAEKIKDIFNRNGCKYTVQRQEILRIFMENPDITFSSREIYALLQKSSPCIGQATVYRALNIMEKMNIIFRVRFDKGCAVYSMFEEDDDWKFVCSSCKGSEDVDKDVIAALKDEILDKCGFRIERGRVMFYGVCDRCACLESKVI